MANLNKFTPDEQLLLILICSKEALINKVIELLDEDPKCIETSLGIAIGGYLRSLTDDEAKELLNTHRANSLYAKALANKSNRANNNNNKST